MNKDKKIIPIFFAIDDGYTPFLAVALQSLIDNASKEYNYLIKILHTNVKEENQKEIKKFESENVNIEYVDLSYYIEKVKDIKDIKINKKKSSVERILDFLRSTENPYVIKVNGVVVKMEFSNNSNMTANSCINKALKNLYLKNC